MAMLEQGRMTLKQICKWIQEKFSYYKVHKNWNVSGIADLFVRFKLTSPFLPELNSTQPFVELLLYQSFTSQRRKGKGWILGAVDGCVQK